MRRKPDFTDEDVGIRTFHLRRRRAAEKALAKIRNGLGKDFYKLNNDEIGLLSWMLEEMWSAVGFYDWEELKFSLLKLEDVEKLIELASDIITQKKLGASASREALEIVRAAEENV